MALASGGEAQTDSCGLGTKEDVSRLNQREEGLQAVSEGGEFLTPLHLPE